MILHHLTTKPLLPGFGCLSPPVELFHNVCILHPSIFCSRHSKFASALWVLLMITPHGVTSAAPSKYTTDPAKSPRDPATAVCGLDTMCRHVSISGVPGDIVAFAVKWICRLPQASYELWWLWYDWCSASGVDSTFLPEFFSVCYLWHLEYKSALAHSTQAVQGTILYAWSSGWIGELKAIEKLHASGIHGSSPACNQLHAAWNVVTMLSFCICSGWKVLMTWGSIHVWQCCLQTRQML